MNKNTTVDSSYFVGKAQTDPEKRMQAIMDDIKTNGPVMACFNV